LVAILIRQYLSIFHVCAAAQFARQSRALELSGGPWKEHQFGHYAAVIGSLVESAAYLEATINELLQDTEDRESSRIDVLGQDQAQRLAAYWLARPRGIVRKYEQVLTILGAEPFEANDSLLSDARDLVALRNELIHFRPKTITAGTPNTQPTYERLKRLARNPWASPNNAIFPDRLLCHACAAWGVETAIAFVNSFSAKIGTAPWHGELPCDPSTGI
jgi:hypothetical protein